jgi:beta-glucosidase
MPADMQTVEQQSEDTPHDMQPYVDAAGNAYDFAFGLNWAGLIEDARTATYGRRANGSARR